MLRRHPTLTVLALALALAGCGDDAPPSGAPGSSPTSAAPRPTTPTREDAVSSVRTAAPSAATGCPATDASNAARPGTVHDRVVRGPETWTLAGSPHRVPDGLSIENGATLTIEPCARVIVGDAQWITVEDASTLVAAGQPGKPILFDSGATEEVRGLWQGILFQSNARTTSKLHYVVVEEAGGDPTYPAAIFLHDDFVLDAMHVQIVRAKRHGVLLRDRARFSPTSTDLVVTASGIAEELSVPIYFVSAGSVGSLPAGRYDGNVTNEIVVEGADVAASATWRNPGEGVRYRLLEGLSIEGPTGPILTVAPGTVLAFAAGKSLWVGMHGDGALVLDGGSDTTRVVLTSARPVPDAGDWGGVHFGEHVSRAATKLAYLTIRFAGGPNDHDEVGCGEPAPAAITISYADLGPRIEHVTFDSLAPTSIAIARDFPAETATDYTAAALGNTFDGGQRCKQSLNRRADGSCPEPVPACR